MRPEVPASKVYYDFCARESTFHKLNRELLVLMPKPRSIGFPVHHGVTTAALMNIMSDSENGKRIQMVAVLLG